MKSRSMQGDGKHTIKRVLNRLPENQKDMTQEDGERDDLATDKPAVEDLPQGKDALRKAAIPKDD
jgi:hypothetical protein